MIRISSPLIAGLVLGPATSLAGPVDINTADAQTLASELKGVGPARAEAIVAHREANGPFESAEELMEVQGIGQRVLDDNREDLMVGGKESASD